MTNHGALTEKSRLAALATVVGLLIVAAVVAIVVVTTGSDPSGAGTPAQAGRKAGTPAASGAVTFAPASPSSSASSTPSAKRSPEPSTSPVAEKSSLPKKARKPITYTVKRGDNLTVIARWFKLHGYGDLYERNKSVIGKDPDLIRPGQKITVSGRGMTVSSDK